MAKCFICKQNITIKNPKRQDNSVCEDCVNNRTKTVTNCDVEFSGVDKCLLTKLYFKNYIIYSKIEFDQIDGDCLSHKEIMLLNESPAYFNESSKFRSKLIRSFCKKNKLKWLYVLTDRYVDAFIDFGMYTQSTDEEFFNDIIERCSEAE